MDLLNFLRDQAISTYLVGLITIIAGVIGFFASRWFSRKKPRIVSVEKRMDFPVIDVAGWMRGVLEVKYKGRELQSLLVSRIIVQNESDETIADVRLTMKCDTSAILDVFENDKITDRKERSTIALGDQGIELRTPYLNSYKLYSDEVRLIVYSTKPVGIGGVDGGGPGWKVEYRPLELDLDARWSKKLRLLGERTGRELL